MSDKEYNKILKQYHKLSDRHILVAETDMPYPDVLKVVALSDRMLVGLMRKNYDQLLRTKRYRKLLFLYDNTEDKDKRKIYADQLNEMQKAKDVWRGIEKCLYGNGNTIHFTKYGELPCIRAKQINRGIPMSAKDNRLQFKLGKTVFGIRVNDKFLQDETDAILSYLAKPEIIDIYRQTEKVSIIEQLVE